MPTSRITTPALSLGSATPVINMDSAIGLITAELSPLGLMLSENRSVHWCNQRFADMFGYSVEALIGQNLCQLYPSDTDYLRIGQRGLAQMADTGYYQDERLMRRSDGVMQWFRVHGRAQNLHEPFRFASWVFEPLLSGVEVGNLTPRQREVLTAMTRGQTSKECAKELGLSPRTVEKIRANLREKFGVSNAAALMSRVAGLPH